jgi:hypothetical protein
VTLVSPVGATHPTAFAGGQGTLPNFYFTELPGVIEKPATGGAISRTPRVSNGAYAAPHAHGVEVLPFGADHR